MALSPRDLLAITQISPFLEGHGFHMSYSLISKECAAGRGPPCAYAWGRQKLHAPEDVLRWARARMRRPKRESAA